jgi:hypothetical protein
VKFSVKSLVIAAALLTLCFLFVSLLNFNLASFWRGVSRTADFFVCGL